MIRLLASLLVLAGAFLLAMPWLPAPLQHPRLADLGTGVQRVAGGLALGAGAFILAARRRRHGDEVSDAPIRSALAGRGFSFVELGDGWQADGRWRVIELSVRRQSDYQATRFGRPWVLVVHLPGEPRHPWPFMPDQSRVIGQDARGFAVVVADLSFDGQQGLLAERLDALCGAIMK